MGKRVRFKSPYDTYFVTSVLNLRRPLFGNHQLAVAFYRMMSFYESRGVCAVNGYVIMPDHFHALITMKDSRPPGKFVGPLKSYFAHTVRNSGMRFSQMAEAEAVAGELSRVWEPRFDEKTIVNEKMFADCLEYIHWNPVRAGLVSDPCEYPYSSARWVF